MLFHDEEINENPIFLMILSEIMLNIIICLI
jgi:hypothetical protein